jgi:lipid-A-disaccharide synthase
METLPLRRGPKIFFSVGEPSGDLHGANLIRTLRERCPDVECIGFGGPKMQAAGCKLHVDLTEMAVLGVWLVLRHLVTFWRLLQQARQLLRQERPDAVVLIDYPGFNWHIARAAKAAGIPVFYYSPPQIWAWARWRVKKMQRFVDHVLCGLPFEEVWYRERGCNATFVGHPYFDEVQHQQLDQRFLDEQRRRPRRLVTILPGSRTQEVTNNLPSFLKAAALVRAQVPDVRFAIATFKPQHTVMARRLVAYSRMPIDVYNGKTPELIQLATCTMAASGSVSLELLHHTKPTVIQYIVNRTGYWMQLLLRKVKYITLVNLLTADELYPQDMSPYAPNQPGSEKVLFPEYVSYQDRSAQVAAHVIEWLNNDARLADRIDRLAALKAQVCQPGSCAKAADYILQALQPAGHRLPAPHFGPATLPLTTAPLTTAPQDSSPLAPQTPPRRAAG